MKAKMNVSASKSNSKYNKSRVMKLAWVYLREIPVNERSCNTWSECLIKAWNKEKNGYTDISIETVYKHHYKDVYNYIQYYSNKGLNNTDADELTADVFIKFNNHINNYDVERAKVKTLLFFIAKNTIIDFWRSKKYKLKQESVNISDYVDNEGNEYFQIESYDNDSIESDEINKDIYRAFKCLSNKQEGIAKMYFIDSMKYKEIADKLDIPLSSVSVTLKRIREKLESELMKYKQVY